MRRQLTARECILLALLGVIMLISGYIWLFYMPMTSERDRCINAAKSYRNQIKAAEEKLTEKRRMESELNELFLSKPLPLGIPSYDNLKPVMGELNLILAATDDYTLSFGMADTTQKIVRRKISMTFKTGDYATAKDVLRQLHDCGYRCILDSVNMTLTNGGAGSVTVNGSIVFFEYMSADAVQAQTKVQTPAQAKTN